MTTAHQILKADIDTEDLENISDIREVDGRNLRTETRTKNKIRLEDGTEVVEATLLTETLTELTSLSLSDEEHTTEEDHVLRLDEDDSLSLIESKSDNEVSITNDKQVAANKIKIIVIGWEFILIESSVDDVSILGNVIEGEVRRVRLNIEDLITELKNFGLIDSTEAKSYDDIDEYTSRLDIYGDVDNSMAENNLSDKGDLTWTTTHVNYKKQKITCGFSRDGVIVVYAPMNLPSSELANFFTDWVIDHISW